MQRLYSGFPGGSPGIALLLLRGVFGIALLARGAICVRDAGDTEVSWFLGAVALIAGALLAVGLMTPIVAAAVALGAVAVAFSAVPGCSSALFTANLPVVFAVTILLTIALLGPGAISVDARLFGRREIIIPPPWTR